MPSYEEQKMEKRKKQQPKEEKEENFAIFMFFLCSCVLCFDKLHVKSLIIYNSSYFTQQFIPKETYYKLRKIQQQKNEMKIFHINLLVYVISCWLCLALHSLTNHKPTQKRNINLTHPHVYVLLLFFWVIILSSHSSLFNHRAMLQSFAYLVKVFPKIIPLKR